LVETAIPTERLAASVRALATSVTDPDARAQLHALAGILDNAAVPPPPSRERAAAAADVAAAMAAGDEPAAIAAARRLAAMDRAGLRQVDWSAASGG
jgi:hypothetical protein